MEELRQELFQKLRELNEFVESNAKNLLGDSHSEEKVKNKSQDQLDASVSERLQALSLMPVWLESMQKTLQDFTVIARYFLPVNNEPTPVSAPSELFPDPKAHRSRLDEYREQQAEKLRKRTNVALIESRFAVDSLVDSAVAVGCNDAAGSQPATTKGECMLLFGRGLPIEAITERLEDLLDEDWTKARTPQRLRVEAERQLALNESEVHAYVDARGASSALGGVVHRLLAIKYPRPPLPLGQDLPRLKVMALLLGVDDKEVLSGLSQCLSEVKVRLLSVQDALEMCVAAYRAEGPGLPLLETREPAAPALDLPEEAKIAASSLVPHALKAELKALEPPPQWKEVETQTGPEVAPQLSAAASLGKQALEMLRLQQPLSDWLTTALLIEHLKQVVGEGVLGWVLVDFPSTFEQCRLFEASISGQWVPNPDLPDEEQGGKFTLVQSQIVADPSDPVEAVQPFCTIFTSVVAVSSTDPPKCLSLLNEVYLRQDVLACFHCVTLDEDKSRSVAELLLRSSPNPPAPHPCSVNESSLPEFEIPKDLALGMAALWEAVENAYLGRLHRLTLTARTQANLVTRYLLFIKKQFSRYLGRKSLMQAAVDAFVEVYNQVPRPWDHNSTDELTSQVERLTDTITEQIETRRREADMEMKEIAEQNWLSMHLAEKLQLLSCVAQLELDRFVDTAALLQDFCVASFAKFPPDASKSVRFEAPKALGDEVNDEWSATLAGLLLAEELSDQNLPDSFVAYTKSMLEAASAYITKLLAKIRTEIGKMENEFKPKAAKKAKKHSKKQKGKGPTVDDIPSLEDLQLQKLTSQRLQLLQEWRDIVEKEAELTVAAVEREVAKQCSQAANLIGHLRKNGLDVMRRAADVQRSSDRQSALELQEFLLSAVATAAHLTPPVLIHLKTHYKSYLKRPNAPAPSTRAKNLCHGLRELMVVLKRLAPDGRILLSGLSYLLSQSAAAGKHLPPKWMQLDKDQIERVLRGHLNGSSVVDWRALMVGLLEVPVASQQQLLSAATRLKEGTFCDSRVWMDSAFEDADEALDAKQLLLDAYDSSCDMLSACTHDPDPLAAFFKACALHQGEEVASQVQLEAALLACVAVTPTDDAEVAPRLQRIWNEAEELALDAQQRRARNRASAAGTYVPVDATSAAVDVLREHDPLIQLARDYFSKQPLDELVLNELLKANQQ